LIYPDTIKRMVNGTIKHVAKEAGVSTATVTRVLDGYKHVSEGAKIRVELALVKTGYNLQRRYKANGNHRKRANNVGFLLLQEDRDLLRLPVFSQLLLALDQVLAEEKMHLVISHVSEGEPLPATVNSERMDAMLLFGRLTGVESPQWDLFNPILLFESVAMSRIRFLGWADCITSDCVMGGRLAANYLLDRGHQRLGYLNPWPMHGPLKLAGESFQDVVRQSGAEMVTLSPGESHKEELDTHDLLNPYRSWLVVKRMVEGLLALPSGDRPSGLYVANDEVTTLVYRSLAEHGVEAGRDIDIISRDNEEPFLATLSPRPASVDLNCEEIARQVVNRILYRLRYPMSPRGLRVLVPPKLAAGEIEWPSERN